MHRIVIIVFYLNLVVSLALAFCTGDNCPNCPPDNQDPRISEILINEEISFGENTLKSVEIQYMNVERVELYCRASYPVESEFEGKDFSSNSAVTSKVYVDRILDPSKTCYETVLLTANDPTSVTGNYTCRSVDGTKSVSFYRYSFSYGRNLVEQ